jgi:hypothetical protein
MEVIKGKECKWDKSDVVESLTKKRSYNPIKKKLDKGQNPSSNW